VTPDDPRHGTLAGYNVHARTGRDYCEPCRRAKAIYDKRRKWDALNGRGYTVPSLGARRRIQALQVMGWSRQRIAEAAGWTTSGALRYVDRSDTITRRTHERIAEAYERIAMTPPPDEMAARRARTWAKKYGYHPPLAWDDIDDPDETPAGAYRPRSNTMYDHETGSFKAAPPEPVDEAVVLRLLAGDTTVTSSKDEKVEAMRRWLSWGKSEKEFCRIHGWKDNRYTPAAQERAA
jgi:hypothetical protein